MQAQANAAVGTDPTDFPHLTNSRPIDWDRTAEDASAVALVQLLYDELTARDSGRKRARKVADADRLRTVLEAIVMDLVAVAAEDPDRFIAYPRRREAYAPELKRYGLAAATLDTVVRVADFLTETGYAAGSKGSFTRTDWGDNVTTGGGYRSRLRPTAKLIEVAERLGLTATGIGRRGSFEFIRLKQRADGGRKELVGYADNDQTRAWRRRLVQWAEVANASQIEAGTRAYTAVGADEGDGAGELVTAARSQLYRVFNDGSFNRGGRFYGGWWMTLSKADRTAITINGQKVVELDFKAFYPRLCYDLEGLPLALEADPYALPELDGRVDRSVLKVALNQLIAVGPQGAPRKPPEAKLPSKLSYRELLSAIERHHAGIAPWLRAARALELQRLDSEIADRVLAYMTHRGIPVLPVHDSFIVAQDHETALAGAMASSYEAVVREASGYSSQPVIDRSPATQSGRRETG